MPFLNRLDSEFAEQDLTILDPSGFSSVCSRAGNNVPVENTEYACYFTVENSILANSCAL